MSAFTDAVVINCVAQLERFKNGQGRETDDPYYKYVGDYWRIGLGNSNIDGRTTYQDSKGKAYRPAWSAAFISYIMRVSGALDHFLYSEAHIHYAIKAIRDAKLAVPRGKFLGRDPEKYAPKIGDIVTAGRAGNKNQRFKTVDAAYGAKDPPKGNFMSTHSDIVVAKSGNKVTTIGGNVDVDTVGAKTWKLNADGTLEKGDTLICVIETLL